MADWINGAAVYLAGQDRYGNLDPKMIGAQVGYFGDPGANPIVGEIYTAHLVVGVGYSPRGGVVHSTSVRLPAHTSFDTSLSHVTCRRQRPNETQLFDATGDPSAQCVQPTLQGDGAYWLGYRDLPQGNLFEVLFNVRTETPLSGELLTGVVQSEYGTMRCDVAVNVLRKPPPSGRLRVRVEPTDPIENHAAVTIMIVTEDAGNGARTDGVATIFNYSPDGLTPSPVNRPTNVEFDMTFHSGEVPHAHYSGATVDIYTPSGQVSVPGYNQDAGMKIPFKWGASMIGF